MLDIKKVVYLLHDRTNKTRHWEYTDTYSKRNNKS